MRRLKHDFGVEHLWFADDIFGLRARWVRELAVEVEKLDAAVPFKMQSRVDLMTTDTVRALRRAGCTEVWLGVESGSQKILDAMDKGTRVEQIVEGSREPAERGNPGVLFPSIRISGRDLGRHPEDGKAGARYPAGRYRSLGFLSAPRNKVLRPSESATRQQN